MYGKSRMELGCAIKTVETDSRVSVMHKRRRMELGFTIMTDESKVCAMYKKIRPTTPFLQFLVTFSFLDQILRKAARCEPLRQL